MNRKVFALPLLSLVLLAGCANLSPDYVRPESPVPAAVDGARDVVAPGEALTWQQVVVDPRLRRTVEQALANNRDLRIAALNIEKARAQYQIDSAALYPAISGTGTGSSTLYQGTTTRKYSAGLGVTSYEIDFFGRLNNLKDVSLQSFLATEATQRSVRSSLIAQTATAWLTLAANQDLLRLAQDTLASRNKTLELTLRQQQLGGASQLSVAQAQAVTEAARGDVASYTTQVVQARNALTLLVGSAVANDDLPSTQDALGSQAVALVDVPNGLSSDVLLRRPDVMSAEHALIGAYANIGAARAAFFPSITLTASGGTASPVLNQLFDAGTRAWTFAPTLTLPIFNAGKLKASLSVAEVSRDIQVATYEKTVQTAFQEVADALAVRQTLNERMSAQQAELDAYARSLRLATERYRSGADSYLTVLDSQRSLYTAQKSLISLQQTEQANRLTLFKVLGGA